ncbi:MAG: hypothetical protein DWQ29_17270 [Planctomycetota bacterium]|nr:MAG: hypothetical protein DWQ29_17270 [Planctomycetota bacterium]
MADQPTDIANDSHERSLLDTVFKLPGAAALSARLGRSELRRRLLHMVPGLLPFVLWVYPHEYPWTDETPIRVWVAGLAIILAFYGLRHFREIARSGEGSGDTSVLGYSFSVLGALAIAPDNPEITLIVLVILAFGDGSATLGGMLMKGPTLFWNRAKTWAGLISFWVVGTLFAAVVYWGEVVPQISWETAFRHAGLIVICAAFAESLPLRMNDNLRVGIATLIASLAVIAGEYRPVKMLIVATVVLLIVHHLQRRRLNAAADSNGD